MQQSQVQQQKVSDVDQTQEPLNQVDRDDDQSLTQQPTEFLREVDPGPSTTQGYLEDHGVDPGPTADNQQAQRADEMQEAQLADEMQEAQLADEMQEAQLADEMQEAQRANEMAPFDYYTSQGAANVTNRRTGHARIHEAAAGEDRGVTQHSYTEQPANLGGGLGASYALSNAVHRMIENLPAEVADGNGNFIPSLPPPGERRVIDFETDDYVHARVQSRPDSTTAFQDEGRAILTNSFTAVLERRNNDELHVVTVYPRET